MYNTLLDPQKVTLNRPDRDRRRERKGDAAGAPIDMAQIHKATNGSFVVEWELPLGA
ncbi:MAG: hypothetical protein WD602_06095 [Actinomycetota bacterium]